MATATKTKARVLYATLTQDYQVPGLVTLKNPDQEIPGIQPELVLRKGDNGLFRGTNGNMAILEFARQCVETMNNWMSGACFCVVIQTNDEEGVLDDYDCYGGLIGRKWAEEELKREMT